MAYSSVTKPGNHFNTVLYTGNGGSQSITGVGFQPDWLAIKRRNAVSGTQNMDSVRGASKKIAWNESNADETPGNILSSFDTDGFSVGSGAAANNSSDTFVAWNWLAGGTAPTQTYTVKVVSDSGNKYRFDDFGTSAVTLDLQEGGTYTFDQSDSSNSGHPLRFATAADAAGGTEYTTGVTTTGTPGSSGAQTVITVAASAPTLYYYCTNHSGMGGQANTNSTHGSSNFAGGTQSTVSVNSTAGFSIINWAGSSSSSVQTIGHGLGATPHWILSKNRGSGSSITAWINYHHKMDASAPEDYTIYLQNTDARNDNVVFGDTAPTSTVFSFNTGTDDQNYISYCFTEKKGYSKFGSYTGNGNADGTFIYTGFKPAFVIFKRTNGTGNWQLIDNKRIGFNVDNYTLYPNSNIADQDENDADILSNGFKLRGTGTDGNGSGDTYIYMAFAENPFVANDSGTVVPGTAR